MRTRAYVRNGNITFRDEDLSPARGVSLWELCPQLAAMDPAVGHLYFNDFYDLPVAANWTITVVGAGSAVAQADGAGGLITFTTDTGGSDAVQIQKIGNAFKLTTAKPLWFEAKLKLNDVTLPKLFVGMSITDTTLIAGISDGVFFEKVTTGAAVTLNTEKGSSKTTTATIATMVIDTFMKFGFYFDGAGSVQYFIDGVYKGVATLHIPDDQYLVPSVAVMNGSGASKVLTLDYVKCYQLR